MRVFLKYAEPFSVAVHLNALRMVKALFYFTRDRTECFKAAMVFQESDLVFQDVGLKTGCKVTLLMYWILML